ncbi:MAG TPA: type II toxin-antitoxin system ParD family antitoxin [Phycisphaerae bacterium]|nr:type II toxin-antitoxin system ParD family antitoxin [Phycisphaerae bacterium]
MPTQNVNLPGHQAEFIRRSVATGRYQNASEVVRAGLRLLEQRDQEDALKLEALRRIAADAFGALDRGEGVPMSPESLDALFERIDRTIRTDE